MQITCESDSREKMQSRLQECVLAAMARMPADLSLGLWLRYCLGFDQRDMEHLIEDGVDGREMRLPEAMMELMRTLKEMNVKVDMAAAKASLMTIRPEPAPPSLIEKIGNLFSNVKPACRASSGVSPRRRRSARIGPRRGGRLRRGGKWGLARLVGISYN
ncbi:MAG: hypothetical protein C0404_01285 [Verrucomicrobia bacterium]|nr:hypothetical protein [Verrucomicrobiota bacterium]